MALERSPIDASGLVETDGAPGDGPRREALGAIVQALGVKRAAAA